MKADGSKKELDDLEKNLGRNRKIVTAASAVSLGGAMAASAFLPLGGAVVGALVGVSAVSVAVKFLTKIIEDERLLDQEKDRLGKNKVTNQVRYKR